MQRPSISLRCEDPGWLAVPQFNSGNPPSGQRQCLEFKEHVAFHRPLAPCASGLQRVRIGVSPCNQQCGPRGRDGPMAVWLCGRAGKTAAVQLASLERTLGRTCA